MEHLQRLVVRISRGSIAFSDQKATFERYAIKSSISLGARLCATYLCCNSLLNASQ